MKFRLLGTMGLTLLFVICLFSQENQPQPIPSSLVTDSGEPVTTVHKKVEEVMLVFSITDHEGKFVNGLHPSELTILDDNRRQTALTFFQSQTDLPLNVAFLLDVSSSVAALFETEQDTMKNFLQRVIRPTDSVILFAFNQGIELEAPVTGNWKQIARRVKKLDRKGDTALYDAVSAASRRLGEDHRPARKIIILVTDGEENDSKTNFQEAVADALRAEVAIYSVNINDEHISTESKQGQQILIGLSGATGGRYLQAQNGNVGRAFEKIQRELRSQYAIAYRPSNLAERVFHDLQVLAPQNLYVHCRTGYYVK
jgi:Ca-activated chloride channel family protein